jgi:hypothetical protein
VTPLFRHRAERYLSDEARDREAADAGTLAHDLGLALLVADHDADRPAARWLWRVGPLERQRRE